ncbi:MAG: site-specific integrase [Lachnospiraceae bacterium]|nr:site-specific integrase [Lachnospiraceae bacterium]
MKQRAGLALSDASVTMSSMLMEQYLNSLQSGGRQKQTIRTYRRSLEALYDFLPPDKEINRGTLKEWKEHNKACGYSDSTVNIRLTAANGFLRFCGREELAIVHERIATDEPMPEMTREEYLQFLSKVRKLGSEKYYFMIKVFASIDIGISELECLTVEACREGAICLSNDKTASIPRCLREELLQYADRHGITEGPVFVTRNGGCLNHSNIAHSIHRLAERADIEPEKCCPSALHRLYLTTKKELMERLMPAYQQSYENLLDTEQMVVGWDK